MRYKPDQKKQTHAKIVDAAGRSFKKNGFSGIGVDGLAKEAGVTSGAFYKHFKSKKAAFESAVVEGLKEVQVGITGLEAEYGEGWWQAFADLYVNDRRTCDAQYSCGLQSLTSEVARCDDDLKATYQSELLKIASLAEGNNPQALNNGEAINDETWQKLAILVGGVTLARAVKDPELSKEIGSAIRNSALFNEG